jgi:hypothetical protein
MNHEKRGIALVINIQNYDAPNPFQLKERIWSVKDFENLQHTLEYLEFDFKLCQNFTKPQIEQVMQEQASIDHSNSDCFLCVVMSHGNEDEIVTSDNKEISFEEIMAPIKECVSLKDKPKLFFFQACRGKMEIPRNKSNSNLGKTASRGQVTTDSHTRSNKSDSDSFSTKNETLLFAKTDLLVYNATLPEHYAFGTEAEGTYFIKSVCEVFNDAYKNLLSPKHHLPLSKMITMINQKVEEKKIQVADPVYRLKKEVYFMPKNVCVSIKKFLVFFRIIKKFKYTMKRIKLPEV